MSNRIGNFSLPNKYYQPDSVSTQEENSANTANTETSDQSGKTVTNFSSNLLALDNQIRRSQIENNWVNQNAALESNSGIDFNKRADELSKIFTRGGFSSYKEISPYISDLSAGDVQKLKDVYQQRTGRKLLMDASNWLPMEDKYDAFKILAPERIKTQDEPKTNGPGINMNPPAKEVPFGSTVQYSLNLDNEIGEREVSYLIEDGKTNVRKDGKTFEGYFPATENNEPNTRLVLFEVRYKGQPSEFYQYYQTAVNANLKAENELNKMLGPAPEVELYLTYLDNRIQETKDYLTQLEAQKASLEAELQNGPTRTTDGSRNSSDVYDDLRRVNQEIERVKAGLAELETSKAEFSKVFADSVGKPIPLQAVLVAGENGQTIPLQLYAKNLGGGKWAIVDVTNPAKPRTYTGQGLMANDALNEAWNNFISSTNDLPAGQIAVVKPKGLGITNENTPWNGASAGKSTLKQFADGLGKGSLLLAGVGVAALFVPGGQGVGVGLLLASGVGGGISSGANIADRINNGTFKLKDSETALDLLGIIGGLASAGGLAALTNAGSKGLSLLANGTKFNLQKVGNFTKISLQYVEQGTNVAGGILISNEYVSAIEQIQKSSLSPEQKNAEVRRIISTAIGVGAIMILGVGLAKKFSPPSESNLNKMLQEAQLPKPLDNLVRTDLRVQKVFVNHGRDQLVEVYDDFLRGGKNGQGLKTKQFGEYLGNRKFSTSLDKSTDSVGMVLGENNVSRMSPRQINERIFEMTNPTLFKNYRKLPKHLKDSVEATLNQNHNISAGIQFKTATEKLNRNLYEGIGREIKDFDEFRRVLNTISNPSAKGSIGNGYAQKNLIEGVSEGRTVKEFNFSSELWTGVKVKDSRADHLLVREKSLLEIKTGYPNGYPNSDKEIQQILNYNDGVNASRNPANQKLRKHLIENGVEDGILTNVDVLFLSNGETNAQTVAFKSYQKIENKLRQRSPNAVNNVRVYFQGEDGKIYQVVKDRNQLTTKLIGDKLPN
jgi:hypothetical protein